MRRSPFALFASVLFLATTATANPAAVGGASSGEPSVAGAPPSILPTAGHLASITSHIKREAVQSTAIASVGYSRRLHALEIEFRNGAIYRYLKVEPATYRNLMIAPSKARFYDEHIRRKYRSLHVRRRSG